MKQTKLDIKTKTQKYPILLEKDYLQKFLKLQNLTLLIQKNVF